MTVSAPARHRAPCKASTPLTKLSSEISAGLTAVVSERMEALGRGGLVVAVSSGMVATMALPASAAPQRETVVQNTGALSVSRGGLVAAPEVSTTQLTTTQLTTSELTSSELTTGELTSGAPLTAPATAVVHFDQGALGATSTPASRALAARALAARQQARTARSAARSALALAAQQNATPARSSDSSSSGSSASTATSSAPAPAGAARGSSVLAIVARYVGVYYLYGGSSPRGFDCSGLTQYVYRQLGVGLPRTADQQLNAVRQISRSQAEPGDLVFFLSGGYATHVGIYAGDGMMYDAPHTGSQVGKRAIYPGTVVYGRVTG